MALYRMRNVTKQYAWGSTDVIPQIIGVSNDEGRPFAELWMGAHASAPSFVMVGGVERPLTDVIRDDPEAMLGQNSVEAFGARLPFLFKILSAARGLSIQAHPDLRQAQEGFAREASLSADDPRRNYRDDNHKPELICAITPFWALCGFRPIDEIVAEFGRREFAFSKPIATAVARLKKTPSGEALRGFLRAMMTTEGDDRQRLLAAAGDLAHERDDPRYFWVGELARQFPDDLGSLAPLYLNCLKLEPGEGLFLGSGILHAYLVGTGVELMANSDNVLRGGLTVKHVDVDELLRVLSFDAERPVPQPVDPQPVSDCERLYRTPAREFRLSVISLRGGASTLARKRMPEVLLCLDGEVTVEEVSMGGRAFGASKVLTTGGALFVAAETGAYRLRGSGRLYRATVGL